MKSEMYQKSKNGKTFCLLILILFFPVFQSSIFSQGWSFTPSIVQTDCGSSSYMNTANAMLSTVPASMKLPTKTQCDAIRQMIDGFSTGGDWYSSGNPPVLHHCSIKISCTPCSGSDIVNTGQVNPGDVSFDGESQGKPFFTTHQSEAFEDWARDYKALLESYGITSILGNQLTPHPVPQTGDKDFDQSYGSDSKNFHPRVTVDSSVYVGGSKVANSMDDFLNKKPVLFRTEAENKYEQERDWLRDHPGLGPFAPVPGDGIPYPEEGDFWSNFVTDPELLKMEQHALFVGITTVAALSGIGVVAEAGTVGIADAVTFLTPVVETSVNALQDCSAGNCPESGTILQNMAVALLPAYLGAGGEKLSGWLGSKAMGGIDASNTSELGTNTFKAVFGTSDSSRDTWETFTKKGP